MKFRTTNPKFGQKVLEVHFSMYHPTEHKYLKILTVAIERSFKLQHSPTAYFQQDYWSNGPQSTELLSLSLSAFFALPPILRQLFLPAISSSVKKKNPSFSKSQSLNSPSLPSFSDPSAALLISVFLFLVTMSREKEVNEYHCLSVRFFFLVVIIIFLTFSLRVDCAADGSTDDYGDSTTNYDSPAAQELLSEIVYSSISNYTSIFKDDISRDYGFCITDVWVTTTFVSLRCHYFLRCCFLFVRL